MNIAVNCRVLLSHRMEGVSRYIYETTKQMVLDHPEDQFYFFFDRAYDPQFIFADNVTPVILRPQARTPVLWKIWFEMSVVRALKRHKIDVFYSGDTYLSLKTKVPTLLVSHDVAYVHYPDHIRVPHLRYYQKYFPLFHKRADHIVAVSEFTRQDIIKAYGLSPNKVSVGYNATPAGFGPLSEEVKQKVREKYTDGKPYFHYVGSLHPRKNVVRLIQAFDLFKSQHKSDHKLVLVGRLAWKNKELQEVHKNLNFKDDIVLTGPIYDDIHEVMGASDGLFYVSLFEGFGIPILEGFTAQIPVVTSNLSSMPEVAGDSAILVDPTDVSSIAAAMTELATNNRSCPLLLKAAQRAESFTWKRTADHIYERLEALV